MKKAILLALLFVTLALATGCPQHKLPGRARRLGGDLIVHQI